MIGAGERKERGGRVRGVVSVAKSTCRRAFQVEGESGAKPSWKIVSVHNWLFPSVTMPALNS
jgi:hypothetical protein